MGNRHLTKPRSPQRLGRSPAVRRGCDRRCRALGSGSGSGSRER